MNTAKKPLGSRARLLSDDWRSPSEPACLQFWYYVNGTGTGTLNVNIITNSSEKPTWSQTAKNRENRWTFVQFPLQASSPFMVSLRILFYKFKLVIF